MPYRQAYMYLNVSCTLIFLIHLHDYTLFTLTHLHTRKKPEKSRKNEEMR